MPLPRNRAFLAIGLPVALVTLFVGGFYADTRYEARDLKLKAEAMTGGSVDRGEQAVQKYGCGGCHALQGVPGAHGLVGPPLDGIAARAIIAGKLENRPDNLMVWIQHPQKVTPGTAMPELGVTPADSRDMAAFLYTRT
jgi:cytochrome c2